MIATLEGFSRTDLDEFALLSQQRAAQAQSEGRFKSIIPVVGEDGTILLDRDEHPRPETTLQGLAQLQPVFAEMGKAKFDAIALAKYPQVSEIQHLHTAGNASGIVDGEPCADWLAGKGRGIGFAAAEHPRQRWSAPNRRLCSPVPPLPAPKHWQRQA